MTAFSRHLPPAQSGQFFSLHFFFFNFFNVYLFIYLFISVFFFNVYF